MTFLLGLVVGVALGMLVIGFLAIGAYDRGYEEAQMRRWQWRTDQTPRGKTAQPRIA